MIRRWALVNKCPGCGASKRVLKSWWVGDTLVRQVHCSECDYCYAVL